MKKKNCKPTFVEKKLQRKAETAIYSDEYQLILLGIRIIIYPCKEVN